MTQHQCRHSQCSTAPERAPEQPVPCASEPETAKPAQFSSRPHCRYPLHPVKRGAATGHSEGSLPSAVLRSSVQGSTQVPNSTRPSGENIQVGGGGKDFEPDTGGNTTKKGDEYLKCPPGLCLVRVLEDQHHPYWVR